MRKLDKVQIYTLFIIFTGLMGLIHSLFGTYDWMKFYELVSFIMLIPLYGRILKHW